MNPGPPPDSSLRVLVAEDNKVSAMLILTLLRRLGIRARHVETGLLACEASRKVGGFDLIFMDVQMPEMDGIEATRRIREMEKGSPGATYIVALTAQTMPGDREKCRAAGMDDYLAKPLRPTELLALLDRFNESKES
ncbi:MAG: response regulator [Terrimicrobiaceae bacterium]|nr:response regulator [Terrimicrobiaceae bacterium]